MSASLSPPPDGGASSSTTQAEPPSSSASPSSVNLVIVIIALSVVVLACIYLLLRYLSHRFHRTTRTFSAADDITASTQSSNQPQRQVASNNLLRSLPLFNFRSVKGNLTGADCAVCLSKFGPPDQLRLLPLCCHAFHAECIDTWIVSNGTCPLCRSPVVASETNVFGKMPAAENRGSGSFRIELGSVSRRRDVGVAEAVGEATQSSYSLGSLDYITSENGYEVLIGGIYAADKEFSIGIPIPEPPGEALTAEVAGGRSWLRDYVDSLVSVSFSSSFRSSGRFFSGSSRRTDSIVGVEALEANRAGEEITEIFRWLSGI